MGTEIERKFLVASEAWREGATRISCLQGYLRRDRECVVRARLMGDAGFLTIKGERSGIARAEFEYAIPPEDARYMLEHLALKPLVEKWRWHVRTRDALWEVDEFLGANRGLVVAEIELPAEDASFERPPWLGREVTHEARYTNASLSINPFTLWKE